jgi:hypothetical protein
MPTHSTVTNLVIILIFESVSILVLWALILIFKNIVVGGAPVAHTCNPRYSGDRHHEDHDPREIVHETLSQ